MNALITALMVWAASATGLPMPKEMPVIRMMPAETICKMFYNNAAVDCSKDDLDNLNIIAVTLPGGVVYLRDTWKPNSLYDISALLHELVHVHQDETFGIVNGPCEMAARERVAYDTQIKFLKAAGIEDPLDFMGLNGLAYIMLTTCSPM